MNTPVLRGVAGRIELDAALYGRVRAKPDQPLDAPMIVRVVEDPGGAQAVEFIGTVAGDYDLLGRLERFDGRALTDVPPMLVSVTSTLPAERATDLVGRDAAPPVVAPLPLALFVVVAAIWLLLPIAALLRRRPRPRMEAPLPERAPTIPEEIAVLAGRSRERPLSTDERGRLELLLMRFWRERLRGGAASEALTAIGLAPDASDAELIRALRHHPAARDVIRAMEAWLHRAPEANAESTEAAATEIDRFLRSQQVVSP